MKYSMVLLVLLSSMLTGCLEDFNLENYTGSDSDSDSWYSCKTPENQVAYDAAVLAHPEGSTLHTDYCAECHSDRRVDAANSIPSINEIEDGREWWETREAINDNEGGMGKLYSMSDAQLVEIAAFLNAYFSQVPATCDDD